MLYAIFILKTQNGNILLGKDVDYIKLGRKQRSGSVFSERLNHFEKDFFYKKNRSIIITISQACLFAGKSNLVQKGTAVVFDKMQIYYNQLLF